MMYELKTEKFSGPIDALLELIERRQLDITELSLAEVTADFLNYLSKIEEVHPRMLADFIVVASRLLLIKSRALLPTLELSAEEEAGIKDLEAQLRFYQNFKPAILYLKNLWEEKSFSLARPYMAGRSVIFYPSSDITVDVLLKSMRKIFEAVSQMKIEARTIKPLLVTLEEKIKEIINLFQKKTIALKFRELKKEKSPSEVIVMFLAVLHLIHSKLIKARQADRFSDIIIEKQ